MAHTPPIVLVVSKPLGPPWTDGSKNLARELVEATAEHDTGPRMQAFCPRGQPPPLGCIPIPTPTLALSRRTTLTMLGTLATERTASLWHFFFAPNARTSGAARVLARARRRPTVQTLASAPAASVRLGDVVFGDRVVALSRATEARALAEGVAPERLVRIAPAIAPPRTPSSSEIAALRGAHDLGSAFVVCFAGDLEHGRGADVLVDACRALQSRNDVILVMACRAKTPRAAQRRAELDARLRGQAVRWIGETPSIHTLLAASDVVALPTDTLYAKVDHPLVLLEAMHLGRPVLVTEGSAAFELAEEGGALGCALEPAAVAHELDRLVLDPSRRTEAGGRALAHAKTRTREAMARAYGAIYDGLLR